jgi:hypothetical protein
MVNNSLKSNIGLGWRRGAQGKALWCAEKKCWGAPKKRSAHPQGGRFKVPAAFTCRWVVASLGAQGVIADESAQVTAP